MIKAILYVSTLHSFFLVRCVGAPGREASEARVVWSSPSRDGAAHDTYRCARITGAGNLVIVAGIPAARGDSREPGLAQSARVIGSRE